MILSLFSYFIIIVIFFGDWFSASCIYLSIAENMQNFGSCISHVDIMCRISEELPLANIELVDLFQQQI